MLFFIIIACLFYTTLVSGGVVMVEAYRHVYVEQSWVAPKPYGDILRQADLAFALR